MDAGYTYYAEIKNAHLRRAQKKPILLFGSLWLLINLLSAHGAPFKSLSSPRYQTKEATVSERSSQNYETSETRSWAVKLGEKFNNRNDADRIAIRDGFINKGPIGDLEGYWLFEPVEDAPQQSGVSPKANFKRSDSDIQIKLTEKREEYEWFEHQQGHRRYLRKQHSVHMRDRSSLAIQPDADLIQQEKNTDISTKANEYASWNDPLWKQSWHLVRCFLVTGLMQLDVLIIHFRIW
jgi:hypothetical protein